MKFTAAEIRKQEFKKKLRGFDPSEVSTFLDRLASEWEEILNVNKTLEFRHIELETQLKDFRSVEKALQQTLVQAQETTGKAIETARKEAHLIIQEAEQRASQIVERSRNDLIALKERIIILQAKKDAIVSRLKMLLNSELDLIKALEVNEELLTGSEPQGGKELNKEMLEIEEIIRSLEQ